MNSQVLLHQGSSQLTLDVDTRGVMVGEKCKERGCPSSVVGSSITGKGHVCKRHNTLEWGRALARNKSPYYRGLGLALIGDAHA